MQRTAKNAAADLNVRAGGNISMITYAANTSKREDWQRDYRLGLILIMPPQEVSQQIDPLRAKHDPRAFPCRSDPLRREMTPEIDEELRSILGRIDPFTLYYDKPHAST